MTREDFYLETCCRSALHRLYLSGKEGRPAGTPAGAVMLDFRQPLKDRPCLDRLKKCGLAWQKENGRFFLTPDGKKSHEIKIKNMKSRNSLFKTRS